MNNNLNCNCLKSNKVLIYRFHDVFECDDCNFVNYKLIDDCCRNPSEMIVIDRYDSGFSPIRKQCIHCGGCLSMTKPLSSRIYGDQIRGEFDKERFHEWKSARSEEKNELYNIKKDYRFKETRYFKYQQYLLSAEWGIKRKLVMERDHGLCQKCKAEHAVDVHHLTYERLFNELLEDLVSVCRPCHSQIHEPNDKAILENRVQ
jgi:hypothetical protein